MTTGEITDPIYMYSGTEMSGKDSESSRRLLSDLKGVFHDEAAFETMDPETEVYHVQSVMPVPQGTRAGLFMGITFLQSGKVGDEYFMTKGHFHRKADSPEYYWCTRGEGMLILMDRNRKVSAQRMYPGSLHYIEPGIAHRVANTGSTQLIFGACWPSDAGHDYETIAREGFAMRLVERDGRPQLV